MLQSATQLAYLAGIIDGEGTLSVYRHEGGAYTTWKMLCSVGSTSEDLLRWLQEVFGGSVYTGQKNKNENAEDTGKWILRNPKAIAELLKGILPYLVIKNFQARLLLKYYTDVASKGRQGYIITSEARAVRDAYCTLFSSLNARGKDSNQRKAEVIRLLANGEVSL